MQQAIRDAPITFMAAISQAQAEVVKAARLWVTGFLTAKVGFHLLIELLLYQLRHPVGDFPVQHVRIELP